MADPLDEVRLLTQRCREGAKYPFEAFGSLEQLLLGLTVMRRNQAVHVGWGRNRDTVVIEPQGRCDAKGRAPPLQLTNGHFLGLTVQLFLDRLTKRLKVSGSRFQYQLDAEGEKWVFRFEYIRDPQNQHPAAHVHVRGALRERVLAPGLPLERVHFPTGRVSLEAVLRLLAGAFGVRCNEPETLWRPALDEAERAFESVARKP